MRKHFLEGFLAAGGAAAALTVAVRLSSPVWAVIGMLLAGVALACLLGSLLVRGGAPIKMRVRGPRRLGARGRYAGGPGENAAPVPARRRGRRRARADADGS